MERTERKEEGGGDGVAVCGAWLGPGLGGTKDEAVSIFNIQHSIFNIQCSSVGGRGREAGEGVDAAAFEGVAALGEGGAGPVVDDPAFEFAQGAGGRGGCGLLPAAMDEEAGGGVVAHVEEAEHVGEFEAKSGDDVGELQVAVFAGGIAEVDGGDGHVEIAGAHEGFACTVEVTGGGVVLELGAIGVCGDVADGQAGADGEPCSELALDSGIEEGVSGGGCLGVEVILPDASGHPVGGRCFVFGFSVAAEGAQEGMIDEGLEGGFEVVGGEEAVVVDEDEDFALGFGDSAQAGGGESEGGFGDDAEAGVPGGVDLSGKGRGGGVVDEEAFPLGFGKGLLG